MFIVKDCLESFTLAVEVGVRIELVRRVRHLGPVLVKVGVGSHIRVISIVDRLRYVDRVSTVLVRELPGLVFVDHLDILQTRKIGFSAIVVASSFVLALPLVPID